MASFKDMRLGEAMQEKRADRGDTQSNVADRIKARGLTGGSQPTLSMIEKGRKHLTEVQNLEVRLAILEEYGFTVDEIVELNKQHRLGLEFVLSAAGRVATDHDLVKVKVVGKMGREHAVVPRRVLQDRDPDHVMVFDPTGETLVDAPVARALRAGAQFLLDTSVQHKPGSIAVHRLPHGGWAAVIDRDDDRPIAVESLNGKTVTVLKRDDLGETVGVVFQAEVPADGLLDLLKA